MNYIVKINPKFAAYGPIIEKLFKEGKPAKSEVIYKGRNELYRLKLTTSTKVQADYETRSEAGELTIIVKDFKKPNLINAFAYTTIRASKARRSYENALKMLSLGFNTPQPVAYCEERKRFKLIRSWYVSLELTGGTEMRHWEDNPDSAKLVKAFARDMRRLHEHGVWHKDFSPGNILYTGNSDKGYSFHYIDLNRMKFNVHARSKQLSMFRAINLNPEETKHLAREYAADAGEDPLSLEQEAIKQLEGYFRMQRRKARLKKILRKS